MTASSAPGPSSAPGSGRQRGRGRSLRRKILLVVMSATCAALFLSASALLVYELYTNRSAWSSDVRSQADLVAQSVAPALVFDDPKAAADALAAFRLRPQIEVAAVFDAAGRPFASYRRSGGADPGTVPTKPDADGERFTGTAVALTRPLQQDGEHLGSVYLRARHDVLGRIVDYLWILALTSAAGVLVAALIFRRLHPAITAPILEMADVSHRIIEDRNYALRVSASSDDEVGVLVTAFNNMLDDLSVQMRERRSAEDALRAADRRKDEFLATLAHELRNPLAPLAAGLAMLERADDDAAVRGQMRQMMQRQLGQMVRLIDDLLEVSRITRGKLELRRETVDVAAVARQAVEAADAALQQKQHALAVDLPGEPLWVNVDSARIVQVLVNLLHNAARYTPRHGHIGIRVAGRPGGGLVEVAVSDDGIGIDASQQQAIFGMFVQVDTSLERGAAGLGIGLTIARELVQLHGGTLSVQSAGIGQGATFSVLLPAAAAPAPPPLPMQPALAAGDAGDDDGLDVLIADDNVDFADSFADILRLGGHRVQVVHDGDAALRAIAATQPAAAFLDIGMPGTNGLEVAAAVRRQQGSRPLLLVAVTGWGQQTDRQRVHDAGFDHHLVKPIDFDGALALLQPLQRVAAQTDGR